MPRRHKQAPCRQHGRSVNGTARCLHGGTFDGRRCTVFVGIHRLGAERDAIAHLRRVPVDNTRRGDSACEEATFLTKFASEVHMIVRRDVLRASKIMAERAIENPKITVHWKQNVTDVYGVDDGKVTGLQLTHSDTGETQNVTYNKLFLTIKHKPARP